MSKLFEGFSDTVMQEDGDMMPIFSIEEEHQRKYPHGYHRSYGSNAENLMANLCHVFLTFFSH